VRRPVVALVAFAVLFGAAAPTLGFLAFACALVIAFHRRNVTRLLQGTENRFTFSRRPWAWRTPRAPEAPQ
jgi:glycerol-3-phosphate acyltransferase PlsY